MAKKTNYSLGDVVSIPLKNGGYAHGVVARMSGKGTIFGYFFGPAIQQDQAELPASGYRPEEAVLVCMCGDHGLINGRWGIVGRMDDFSKENWPLPVLARHDQGEEYAYLSTYDDELNFVSEQKVLASNLDVDRLIRDSAFGSGIVEVKLTKILSEPKP